MPRLNSGTLVSKDEFSCASFGPYEKFVRRCPPTRMPTQMLKSVFSLSVLRCPNLVSLHTILYISPKDGSDKGSIYSL